MSAQLAQGPTVGPGGKLRRKGMRRAVVALPNGFTLFNLFCGIYAIILASRGEYATAAKWIVVGGVADALDGRVARATGTGSRFGEELDSLVDAISFGFAPAMIMFFAVLSSAQTWQWIFVFLFTSCAVMRLARFNVEQAGRAKTHFHGLPSPAAGMTLASYYLFATTPLYTDTVILFTDHATLESLPWRNILPVLMVALAYLMISDVPYPNIPIVGFRSPRQWAGTVLVVGTILGLIFVPTRFIFPALISYIVYGLVRGVGAGFLAKRRRSAESIYWEEEPNGAPPDDTPDRFQPMGHIRASRPAVAPGTEEPRPTRPPRAPRASTEPREPLEPKAAREARELRDRHRRRRRRGRNRGNKDNPPDSEGGPPDSSPPPSGPTPPPSPPPSSPPHQDL
jgi:CDP-diacylglycerol--serine O-phosphatidyltransferase